MSEPNGTAEKRKELSMKNKFINKAGDQRTHRDHKRKRGRRRNWEMAIGKKTISFSVQDPMFKYLKTAAESRKLRLPVFIRNAVFEWVICNL